MTTANKVTIFRILLIPFFVVEMLYYMKTGNEVHRYCAMLAFGVAAVCDGVDGYLARHFNQRSELGAILDPLADKLLLVSAVVLCSLDNPHLASIPLWLTGTIIGRDLVILLGMVVIHMTVGKVIVQPSWLGKAATLLQIICVAWVLLKWDRQLDDRWFFGWTLGAAIGTGVSGLIYVWHGVKQLSSHPASSPTARQ